MLSALVLFSSFFALQTASDARLDVEFLFAHRCQNTIFTDSTLPSSQSVINVFVFANCYLCHYNPFLFRHSPNRNVSLHMVRRSYPEAVRPLHNGSSDRSSFRYLLYNRSCCSHKPEVNNNPWHRIQNVSCGGSSMHVRAVCFLRGP